MELKCENCKFFRKLHMSETWHKGLDTDKNCCVMLVKTEDDNSTFVLEVAKNDECEMFTKKEIKQ